LVAWKTITSAHRHDRRGTGLSAVLEGLKSFVPAVDITAIVTVTDDGGSSGRLRRELDVLPPATSATACWLSARIPPCSRDFFQYRFSAGRGLKGHSFGNLFLTAMTPGPR